SSLVLSLFCLFTFAQPVHAQETPIHSRATVTAIVEEQELRAENKVGYIQKLEVARSDTNEKVHIVVGSTFQPIEASRKLRVGQSIVVSELVENNQSTWVLVDSHFRLPTLGMLAIVFFLLVVGIARVQGVLSIVGMVVSFAVLLAFVVPQILTGANPLFISILASMVIGAASMYLSHGINLKSHIAFGSIIVTLTVVTLLSSFVLQISGMQGTGSEEAVFLQIDPANKVNLQGLLLAGIVLGTLGILDDICIAQVSVIKELIQAKPSIQFKELLSRGLSIGKDHIASLVNTLILAYAGASLPLFLLFVQNNTRPWWVVLNDEMIAEEIVRTLSGSIGLVLAVPLTTLLAAVMLKRKN
nr:YibE/F family protein [Candidatus Woesebacteria bacterium]